MKNGNLYKLAAFLMAMVLLSAIAFAQNDKEEKAIKKKKTMMISMTVDDDGETTTIDTIVLSMPDVDLDSIMEDFNVQMDITRDEVDEIRMEVYTDIDEAHQNIRLKTDEQAEEIEKALKDLQKELDQLQMDDKVRQRIQEAMETLEKMGESSSSHLEHFFMDEDHSVFAGEDGNIEVIVKSDGDQETTEVIWYDEEGNVNKEAGKDLKVWVSSDKNKKVIINKDGEMTEETEFIIHMDTEEGKKVIMKEVAGEGLIMLNAANDKDIDKAILAGLPMNKDQMFEEMNINMEMKGDADPIIKLRTESEEKMVATLYDEDFNKVKKMKMKRVDGENVFELDHEMLEKSKATYILFEQADKTDLMKLKF